MFKCDDDMIECPYNKSHVMLRKRLQSHLLKCRIQFPDVELMKCPFNATHLVPEPEFTHHVTNCPDRKLITQYKYDAPVQKEEEIPSHAPVESEDNWDDTDATDYDPKKYAKTAAIIRIPEGPTPSERKEFIKKERKRLGDEDTDDDEPDVEDIPVQPTVSQSDNNETRRQEYDRNRPRSARSRSPNEYSNPSSSSQRERRHRSHTPPSPPSYSGSTQRERRRRSPSPPPPPVYSASAHRDRSSYDLDNDPYYSRSSDKVSFSDARSHRRDTGKDSYSGRDRDSNNRSSKRSRECYDNTARNSEHSGSSHGSRSYTNNYNPRD